MRNRIPEVSRGRVILLLALLIDLVADFVEVGLSILVSGRLVLKVIAKGLANVLDKEGCRKQVSLIRVDLRVPTT
jgi:hypothetical protein